MNITNKLATVLMVLIIFLSLSISVYGEMNTKSYFYYPPLYQTSLFNNPQLQSTFDYNINSDEHADRINLYPTHLYDTDTQFSSESSSEPTARLVLGKNLMISTDDDTLLHGSASGNYGYHLGIHNLYNTDFEDLKFNISASDIDPDAIRWDEYSDYDGSSISWDFPTEFIMTKYDYVSVGYESTTVGTDNLNVDLSRSMNVTDFDADGYQLAEFTVTFTDMDFIWASVNVDVWDRYELEPRIISASGPTDVLLTSYPAGDQWAQFNFNCSKIEINTPYTFTVVLFVDLTDNVPPPIKFKPEFRILLEKECYDETIDIQSQIANMPNNMLFTNISAASASTNILNTWNFVNVSSISGYLEYMVEPVDPRAEFGVGKMVTIATDDDNLSSGPFTGFNRYFFNIYNIEDSSDTELSDIEFEVNANNINENNIWWREYSSLDGSLLSWTFPPEFVFGEDEGIGVGYDTSESEVANLDVDISRSFNKTEFYSDGYQLAQFDVTFDKNDSNWAWGSIDVWEDFEIKPTIIDAYASNHDVLNDFGWEENNVHFNFDYGKIEVDTTYTFTALIYVYLNDDLAPPMRYKPRFEVTVNKDYNQINGGQSLTAIMPDSMLFNSINAASATTDISNIWSFSNYSEVSGILEQEIKLMGPRADFVFEKNFIVGSDSDSLLNGEYTENPLYTFRMENSKDETDTVMGDLEFSASTTDEIQYLQWEEFAEVNVNQINWTFSSNYVLNPDDYEIPVIGLVTDYTETRDINMDMSRSVNKTTFDKDGYQLATFTVKFLDNDMLWVNGNIEANDFYDVNISLIPESFTTNAPIYDQWVGQNKIDFNIHPDNIILNEEYTFSILIRIDLPEGSGIDFVHKPEFDIGINIDEIIGNTGPSNEASMPEDMLRDNVTFLSASSNISNIWLLVSRSWIMGEIEGVNEISSIEVTDFTVSPDLISINNPALISANITGINLYDVGFLVIEPESGTVPIVGFMDHIGGDQYRGSWNSKIFDITNGTTTMEPLVLIEEDYAVMGDLKINESTDYQFAVAVFNETHLIDMLDDEDNSIFDQIEYDMTVFNPCYVTSLSNGPQPYEEGL